MIKKNYFTKHVSKLTIILTILFLCAGIPAMIALSPHIYFNEIKNTNAKNKIENVNQIYENVYEFLIFQKTLSDDFTNNEKNHMRDVRLIFNMLKGLALLTILYYVTYFVQIKTKYKTQKHKTKNEKIKQELKNMMKIVKNIKTGSIISLIIIIFLAIITTINFSESFQIFHKVFFPQGNWMFPQNSLLITLYPQSFFINITQTIFLITIIFISLIIITTTIIENYFKKKQTKNKQKTIKK